MKLPIFPRLLTLVGLLATLTTASAHIIGDDDHDHGDTTPGAGFDTPLLRLLAATTLPPSSGTPSGSAVDVAVASRMASIFSPFAPRVRTRSDANFLYVESDAMPDHVMMVGITAWQQQVPLPQPYTGANAWRIPVHPVVAQNPLSAKSHFFRGAIALAANGVPIFNPIKNDGVTDTFLAGELDRFGGHCGRADDYHYHIAPTHLQSIVGNGKPIAYALDGYPIHGFAEPDGTPPTGLDAFNGHTTPALGYHYHATKTYPYLNGGFHGEVAEVGGQVDPQPDPIGIRPALPPWRGARITGFTQEAGRRFSVEVTVGSAVHHVNYAVATNGTVDFEFVGPDGKARTESYSPRKRGDRKGPRRDDGPGGPGDGPRDERPPRRGPDGGRPGGARIDGSGGPQPQPAGTPPFVLSARRSGQLVLTSPAVSEGQELPAEFTGEGAGVTPPLSWKGAPAGTQSFVVVMDHLAKGPEMKCYWTLWDIPATATGLAKAVQGVGKSGATWKRGESYVPPHSAGGGPKTYTLHLYALSAVPLFDRPASEITREMLLQAIRDTVLDSAELNVVYTPKGGNTQRPPRPREEP
ncbi:MAG: YHYH protein [Limisphaerales bacterium]